MEAREQHAEKQPKARSSGKTFALWFLLILMFIAIYELIGTKPGEPPRTIDPAWAFGLVMLALLGGIVGWWRWLARAVGRYNRESRDALDLLARGDLNGAAARFDALAQRWRRPKNVHLVARHNLAWTLLRKGELKRAIDGYEAILRAGGGSTQLLSTAHLAVAHALAGDLDASDRRRGEVERLLTSASGDVRAMQGLLAWSAAMVALRRGKPGDALAVLDPDWRVFENQLAGDVLRPMRLIRAYALSLSSGPRDAAQVDLALAPLRNAPPGELDFLAASWPELRVFLDAHPL